MGHLVGCVSQTSQHLCFWCVMAIVCATRNNSHFTWEPFTNFALFTQTKFVQTILLCIQSDHSKRTDENKTKWIEKLANEKEILVFPSQVTWRRRRRSVLFSWDNWGKWSLLMRHKRTQVKNCECEATCSALGMHFAHIDWTTQNSSMRVESWIVNWTWAEIQSCWVWPSNKIFWRKREMCKNTLLV